MARRKQNNVARRQRDRITNVRITDPSAGVDGLHVDRQISAMKTSESQVRVLIGDGFDVGIPTTTDTSGSWGFEQCFATDEFASMIQQYNLARITSIRFDIYDLNPNAAAYNVWGIWHDNYTGTVPAYTRANIADLPDSRVLSAGTGQTTLYWVAHGTQENNFQASYAGGSLVEKFGGLRYFVAAGGAALTKYSVVVHAVVDFRGRR